MNPCAAFWRPLFQRSLLLCCLFAFGAAALADGMKFNAQLIWGTDEEKPNAKNLTPASDALKEKLCGVFKWKHYFVVGNKDLAIPAGGNARAKLSEKCEIEVQDMGKGAVEAKLIGEGKLWQRVRKTIPQGEHLVLAGDDKDSTAWFVVLAPAP